MRVTVINYERLPAWNAASLIFFALVSLGLCDGPAEADSAYINQAADDAEGGKVARPSVPAALAMPAAPRSTSPIATPETAIATGKSLNLAQTLEIGRNNIVAQFQVGKNNISNVGIVGGTNNAVGIWQAGSDASNLYLVNTQGLSIGVLQPKGAAPSNVLIARLPNGALLIKK